MNKWTTIAPQCSGEAESHRENLCVNLGTVGSGPRSLVWQRTRRGIANDTRDTWVLDSDDNIHDIKPSGRRFCPFAWPLWPLLGPSDTLQMRTSSLGPSGSDAAESPKLINQPLEKCFQCSAGALEKGAWNSLTLRTCNLRDLRWASSHSSSCPAKISAFYLTRYLVAQTSRQRCV